jgi:hypothetical protein
MPMTPRTGLSVFFLIILGIILGVNVNAVQKESLFNIPAPVTSDPWFQATLTDAYLGFITFYAWVFYRSPTPTARIVWFIVIMLTGNIGMAAYGLYRLWKWPKPFKAAALLLRTERAG